MPCNDYSPSSEEMREIESRVSRQDTDFFIEKAASKLNRKLVDDIMNLNKNTSEKLCLLLNNLSVDVIVDIFPESLHAPCIHWYKDHLESDLIKLGFVIKSDGSLVPTQEMTRKMKMKAIKYVNVVSAIKIMSEHPWDGYVFALPPRE